MPEIKVALFLLTLDTTFPAWQCKGGVAIRHPDDPGLYGITGRGGKDIVIADEAKIRPCIEARSGQPKDAFVWSGDTWIVRIGKMRTLAGREVIEVYPIERLGNNGAWLWACTFGIDKPIEDIKQFLAAKDRELRQKGYSGPFVQKW